MIENGSDSPGNDLTGEKRIIWNILSSWGGQMVFVVAGFVMPRMIDRHIGQTSLGIWDFSWSLVSYFGLAGLGVGSSVNRYVAKLRAAGDKDGLDEAMSSVVCVQVVIATAIGIMTAALVGYLPHFFREHPVAEMTDARWVVGLLGATLAVQQGCDAFRGLMTGCHRWDLHNGINSISYGITAFIMVVFLSLGHGLRSMAAVYLGIGISAEIYRYFIVRRICPEVEIRIGKATWKQAREMLSFGIKSIVAGIPGLVITQGSSLLVARYLGPAMLAVFSRPIGLVRNGQMFIDKYALVLTPTAGSLQGAGLYSEIRDLMIRTTRYSVALSLPIVLFLSIMGRPILHLWMGTRYDAGWIMAILAVGYFLQMTQQSAMTILVGLNAHGSIGAMNLFFAVMGMGIGAVVLWFTGWSLVGAAILIAITRTLQGVSIIIFSCRRLDIPLGKYLKKSFLGPMAAGVPTAIALAAVNYTLGTRPLVAVAAACAVTVIILAPIYWKYFLPQELKSGIRRFPCVGGMIRMLEIH
jgi:O-antigen/teichoic acid export membrane protein